MTDLTQTIPFKMVPNLKPVIRQFRRRIDYVLLKKISTRWQFSLFSRVLNDNPSREINLKHPKH